MPSCEERIYSNDYYSALLDFWPLDEEINLISPDFCYMKISDILGVLVIDKKILTSLSFIPKGHPLIHAPVGQADFVR